MDTSWIDPVLRGINDNINTIKQAINTIPVDEEMKPTNGRDRRIVHQALKAIRELNIVRDRVHEVSFLYEENEDYDCGCGDN